MDIFQFHSPAEFALFDFPGDGFQAARDGRQFLPRKDADFLQHAGMGQRAANVVAPEPVIEGDGFRELGYIRARPAGEAAAAGDG